MNLDAIKAALAELPLIDNHCHLYQADNQAHELATVLNLSALEKTPDQCRQTMIYRLMLRELGSYLNLSGATDEEILARRDELRRNDYAGWTAGLFNEGRVEALLIDTGYRPAAQPLERFEKVHPCGAHYIFRMESALDPLWQEYSRGGLDFREVEDRYYAGLDAGLGQDKIVALKSILGYRTGLEVQPVDRSELLAGGAPEKNFRDYFLFQTMKRLAPRRLPIQLHAAFGESHINMRNNNPIMLKYILDQSEFRELPIVLVHGGYPRCFEAGFLAMGYPNVYVDLSEMIPFVPLGAKQGIIDILNMAPFNKVLYGSDGFLIPEIHWLGSRMIRRIMADVLADFIDQGLFDFDRAVETASLIFSENSRKLYRLDHMN